MPAAHRNPHSLGAAALGLPAALAPAHTDERLCTASMKRVGAGVALTYCLARPDSKSPNR